MRFTGSLRRIASALVAALVLSASLAGSGHAHAALAHAGDALSAGAEPARGDASALPNLDCALCATATRLAQGAALTPAPPLDVAAPRVRAPEPDATAPRAARLAPADSRAPPRIG
jgi:hypothetical protein